LHPQTQNIFGTISSAIQLYFRLTLPQPNLGIEQNPLLAGLLANEAAHDQQLQVEVQHDMPGDENILANEAAHEEVQQLQVDVGVQHDMPGGDDVNLPGGDDNLPGEDGLDEQGQHQLVVIMPGGDDDLPGGDDANLPGHDGDLPGGEEDLPVPGGDDDLPGDHAGEPGENELDEHVPDLPVVVRRSPRIAAMAAAAAAAANQ
jgi:hypothetical protein